MLVRNAELVVAAAAILLQLFSPVARAKAGIALLVKGAPRLLPSNLQVLSKAEYEAIQAASRSLPRQTEALTRIQNELSLAEREWFGHQRAVTLIER